MDINGTKEREIIINKVFNWGNEIWHVPAVYSCEKGLVVDLLVEVSSELVKAYIDQWDLLHKDKKHYTEEEQEKIQREHPLNIKFQPTIEVNGVILRYDHGCGNVWIAPSCLTDEFGMDEIQQDKDIEKILMHYGLDSSRCWAIHRCTFQWESEQVLQINTLKLQLERKPEKIAGICFEMPVVGNRITFHHPVTGMEHVLTVYEYEQRELERRHFPDKDMEYPTHYIAMAYTIYPEISEVYQIQDCNVGDRPRRRVESDGEAGLGGKYRLDRPLAGCSAMAVSVIGRASGAASVVLPNGETAKLHTVCSSLRFAPAQNVQWRMIVEEKKMEDMNVRLLP